MMSSEKVTLKVIEVCGPHCGNPDQGEQLFHLILPILQSGKSVILDFDGVKTIVSLFLNPAIGRLYGKFDDSFLDSHLQWVGLDEVDRGVVSVVIQNAKEFYRKEKSERERQGQIVKNAMDKKI